MSRPSSSDSGFTLMEILIGFLIIAVVLGLSVTVFMDAKRSASQNSFTDSMASLIEEAKANAMSGRNGITFGVSILPDSLVMFAGSAYDPSDSANRFVEIPDGLYIDTTISGGTIVFSRLFGTPSATGTITIANNGSSTIHTIFIGNQGDLRVLK